MTNMTKRVITLYYHGGKTTAWTYSNNTKADSIWALVLIGNHLTPGVARAEYAILLSNSTIPVIIDQWSKQC